MDKPAHILCVGTTGGIYIYHTDAARETFTAHAHALADYEVNGIAADPRNPDVIYATGLALKPDFGQRVSQVFKTTDGGIHWSPTAIGLTFGRIWTVVIDPHNPDTIYAGSDPANLIRSPDGGETAEVVLGFATHPTSLEWWGPFGPAFAHTVIPDAKKPKTLFVGVSVAGVYRSDNRGKSFQICNTGIGDDAAPPLRFPESHRDIHKLNQAPTQPRTLYITTHSGAFRSDNRGETWVNITEGLPSDVVRAMTLHPRKPGTVWVVPVEQLDDASFPKIRGDVAVYRSTRRGKSWKKQHLGLPKNVTLNIYREGLAADAGDPVGLYLGLSTGQVYASTDEGDHWRLLFDNLPNVRSVKPFSLET